jgi:S1-C subfamily serine protease
MRGLAPRDFALRMREPFVMAMGRTRGRLGVGVQDLTPQLATYFGVEAGVLVTQVNDGSPAARGGMKAGDVITRIGTTPVARASDITTALTTAEGGATVTVDLVRDRAPQSLTVTLDARPTRAPTMARPRGRTAAEQ